MGNVGPTKSTTSGLSGRGGGRILPGSVSNDFAPWAAGGTGPTPSTANVLVDKRYQTVNSEASFNEALGAPSSAAGQAGRGNEFLAYHVATNNPGGFTLYPKSGGGGGWGAAGGNANMVDTNLNVIGTYYGGAAGKAINTAGNTVTWMGGSNRVYGAVG